jgi:fatty acid desaturase
MNETSGTHLKTLPLSDYAELERRVTEAGCFRRTYLAHTAVFTSSLVGLAGSAWVVTLTDSIWIQTANAIVAGFFLVQLGLLAHELSHNSVLQNKKLNRSLAVLLWGLGAGLSEGRWFEKHNAHHQAPNHIGHDPDVEIPFVFSHEHALLRSRFHQTFIFPYQHILFWFGVWFVYPFNILNSMRYLFRNITLRSAMEIMLIIVHFALLFGFTFWFLPVGTAILFNVVLFLVIGIYMAMAFAPNHKGEEMIGPDEPYNWAHQISLSRNITHTPITQYIFGGLEHQIEHHLFPSMSRFKYPTASAIVKEFCREHDIRYHQTSWLESMREIHRSLKEEAAAWPASTVRNLRRR